MAMPARSKTLTRPGRLPGLLGGLMLAAHALLAQATTPLADGPPSSAGVPGNLAIALSVEFPTAVSVAHVGGTYTSAERYLGYFDPDKCYRYQYASDEKQRHFYPDGAAANRKCTGSQSSKWSGNFMNWATMQTIDPFRWAMTGGYRVTDDASTTIIEKAWASGQGNNNGNENFPDRKLGTSTLVSENTPQTWSTVNLRVRGRGNKLRFATSLSTLDAASTTDYVGPNVSVSTSTAYEVSVRVKVCDPSASAGGLEPNCLAYPNGNYKPTGLVHKYADRIRYSLFSYLNDSNLQRDGGVLRARQKFVGPSYTLPGSASVSNAATEWDPNTGVFFGNPDPSDATATSTNFGVTVARSGFINYINQFGQVTPGDYKSYDPVGELYYATLRYFRNLGNVAAWSNMGSASVATKTGWIDGFPVIRTWDDPILYACQKNFVLGIGDVNTHADKNVPGNTGSASEPSKPAAVSADTGMDAVTYTNKVGVLHGLGNALASTSPYNGCCNNNSALMAGLAYQANTTDMRPDDAAKAQTIGLQTVQTFWLDVLEYQKYKANNQYYLAAKYGGFKAPTGFSPLSRGTDLPLDWWSTSGDKVDGQDRPDNYFVASQPDQMVAGLSSAFARISQQTQAFTSAFASSLPQVSLSGAASYATQYDSGTWAGEITASSNVFDASSGETTQSLAWSFSAKLAGQLTGSGWDTNRRMISWNTSTLAGVPFRLASLSSAQQSALDTSYRTGNDAGDYLNYLRGERKNEVSSTDVAGAKAYRDRVGLVGDIINARVAVVGPPSAVFSSASNGGYDTFKSAWANRQTMLYVGTNAGVLHGIDASLTGGSAGQEVFAYVPGALFNGPTAPNTDGLASIGKPEFVHHNMVDAAPKVLDIDFGRTAGGSGTDWRSLLVSGLGKGGKSYVAIDVTNPAAFGTEAASSAKVLWEFSDPDLGYSYGEPVAVKLKQYGWVLAFGSGYNNSSGKGHFFIVNPRTGQLLQKVSTGEGGPSSQAGLAQVAAFVLDRSDFTADALYAGDLLGNLWRLDVRAASGSFPAPVKLAQLRNGDGQVLPVTAKPLVVVQPGSNRRFVTVGAGRLLANSDISGGQAQAFFAILDGNGVAFASAASLPAGVSFPFGNSNLRRLTDLTQPVVLNYNSDMGWWLELGQVGVGPGWRVLSEPVSFSGTVAFTAMRPSGEVCSPSGSSRVFAIDLGTGKSTLLDNGVTVAYVANVPGVVRDLRFYSVDGKARLRVGTDTGATRALNGNWASVQPLRRLNWRELTTAD